MKTLAQAVGSPGYWRHQYLSEELERRGLPPRERQDFLGSRGGRAPDTAEPEVLDAWLDRELNSWR